MSKPGGQMEVDRDLLEQVEKPQFSWQKSWVYEVDYYVKGSGVCLIGPALHKQLVKLCTFFFQHLFPVCY